jgi:deoxyribose-phosphate aldolase
MDEFFASFKMDFDDASMSSIIQHAETLVGETIKDTDVLKRLFSCIDLTTLSSEDCTFSVGEFCQKVNEFDKVFNIPSIGAVCVFPVFAPVLKNSLKTNGVKKAVVAGGFPSSQTFTDIKIMEITRSVELGVDEIDVVIPVGEFLDGNYEFVLEEVRMMKEAAGNAHLKVILETGLLKSPELIWQASLLAMEGGADFIKTSTGKVPVSATPQAAFVMLQAIKAFYQQTNKKVGFKAAGGIVNTRDAGIYYLLVNEVLGGTWLNNEYFRIGASRLANNLLTDISQLESGSNREVKYF